jgi:hypothetical protein
VTAGVTFSGSFASPSANASAETQIGIQPSPSAPDRGGRAPADPERRPARLRGRRLDRDPVEREEPTREGGGSIGEQRAQRLHRLVGARPALARRHANRVEVRPALAADADPQDHASARGVVERGKLLRDHARVPEREEDDPGAERDPFGHGGEDRQRDDDVQDGIAVRDVVAGPDRVVAELLGTDGDLAEETRVGGAADELAAALDPERGDRHRARRQARS